MWRVIPLHLLDGLRIHGLDWFVEIIILNAAYALAFWVRYGGRIPAEYIGARSLLSIGIITATYTASVVIFRSYRIVWRFASVRDMVRLALTVAMSVLLIAIVELGPLRADRPIPLSALAIGGGRTERGASRWSSSAQARPAWRWSGSCKRSAVVTVRLPSSMTIAARSVATSPAFGCSALAMTSPRH